MGRRPLSDNHKERSRLDHGGDSQEIESLRSWAVQLAGRIDCEMSACHGPWESLPFIDEHQVVVRASRHQSWQAVVGYLAKRRAPAAVLAGALGAEARGYSAGRLGPGSTIPGFRVSRWEPPEHLVLEGWHRFSTYALVVHVEEDDESTMLRAQTLAAFPGVAGRLYRHAVIGSGFHAASMRTILGHVRRNAEAAR